MKKALLSLTLIGIIAFITVLSCKKTVSNPTTITNATPSLNQLFSSFRYTPQNLSVTAGRDTIVYGTKGTKLHFYINSFKDGANNTITSGIINLQLIEMYTPKDMICNRAATTANDSLLSSGGEINIIATMNGIEVFANKYGIGFKQSEVSLQPMELFYGSSLNSDTVTTWTEGNNTTLGTRVTGTIADSSDPSNPALYYLFDSCTNLTFVNCDHFSGSDSQLTSVSVIVPDTSFHPSNTQFYLVIPATKCVICNSISAHTGATSYNPVTNTISLTSETQTKIVPAGTNYELVLITNKNGQYYYYEQSGIIPHNGLVATAAMAPESQGDILSRLAGL